MAGRRTGAWVGTPTTRPPSRPPPSSVHLLTGMGFLSGLRRGFGEAGGRGGGEAKHKRNDF